MVGLKHRSAIGILLVRMICNLRYFILILAKNIVIFYSLQDRVSTNDLIVQVILMSNVFEAVGIIFSYYILLKLRLKTSLVVSIIILAIGVYNCAWTYITTEFIWILSISSGLVNGIVSSQSLWLLTDYYPNHKSKTLSMWYIMTIFSLLFALICIYKDLSYRTYKRYRRGLINHSIIILILGFLGMLLIKSTVPDIRAFSYKNNVKILLRSIKLYVAIGFVMIVTLHKLFFWGYLDYFIRIDYNVYGAIVEFFTAVSLGVLIDKFSHFKIITVYIVALFVHSLTYSLTFDVENLRFLLYFFHLGLNAAGNIIMPIVVINLFSENYRESYSLSGIGCLLGSLLALSIHSSSVNYYEMGLVTITLFPIFSMIFIGILKKNFNFQRGSPLELDS